MGPSTSRGTFLPVITLSEDLVVKKTVESNGGSLHGVLFTVPGKCRLFLILGNYSKNAGSGEGSAQRHPKLHEILPSKKDSPPEEIRGLNLFYFTLPPLLFALVLVMLYVQDFFFEPHVRHNLSGYHICSFFLFSPLYPPVSTCKLVVLYVQDFFSIIYC